MNKYKEIVTLSREVKARSETEAEQRAMASVTRKLKQHAADDLWNVEYISVIPSEQEELDEIV